MATTAQELAALRADVDQVMKMIRVLAVRMEENPAAHFGAAGWPESGARAAARRCDEIDRKWMASLGNGTAPAPRSRRRGDRPGYLRPVDGAES